jgi:hypothetical protein
VAIGAAPARRRGNGGDSLQETSPLVTTNAATPASLALEGEDAMRKRLKQGRAACGTDMKIVDPNDRPL